MCRELKVIIYVHMPVLEHPSALSGRGALRGEQGTHVANAWGALFLNHVNKYIPTHAHKQCASERENVREGGRTHSQNYQAPQPSSNVSGFFISAVFVLTCVFVASHAALSGHSDL